MLHQKLALCFVLCAGAGGLFLTHPVEAENWNRFRGPNGTGISPAKTIPIEWTKNECNWTVTLAGRGHASPVSWGSRVFVASADEKKKIRILQCLDSSSGKELWRKDIPFEPYRLQKNNSFASSTPTVDADHVYALWHSRVASPLIAYDHSGQKVWEFDLGPYLHGQGGATSPITCGDLVVVANDHRDDSFLLAVDRLTGQERWRIPREGKRACYGTPCINRPGDRPAEVIFSHCYEGIIGVDLKTGHQNWHIDVFGQASQRALGSPIVAGDLVIASSGGIGGKRQVVGVRPQQSDGQISVKEAYRLIRQAPHVPTPLAYRRWLFLWSDAGIATCVERDSGKVIWQKRIGGNFFSSPICIDGKLYCVDLDGDVVVIAASNTYELLGRSSLGFPSRATPAVSNGTLLIRTESQLFSIGGDSYDGWPR